MSQRQILFNQGKKLMRYLNVHLLAGKKKAKNTEAFLFSLMTVAKLFLHNLNLRWLI